LEGKYLAIIVDKVQKRRDIALSCTDLLLEKGIKKLTVAEVAKRAGVAKGSIYDYFENKEDIVFEIIRSHIEKYQQEFESKIQPNATTREKLFLVFDFILSNDPEYEKQQNFYKEYVSIDLGGENTNMCSFNGECSNFFRDIIEPLIEEGIQKGELIEESRSMIRGLLALEKGFLFIKWTEKVDVKDDLRNVLNTLFDLLEVKSDC
jgi:TetR/AcrR family transcriptional regulator, acrAB operon repressor